MEIVVKRPTEQEIIEMRSQPVWECDVSEFDWFYDQQETALMMEGEVTMEYAGKSVCFAAGDYVEFPKGLSCVWRVSKPVKKHYKFH